MPPKSRKKSKRSLNPLSIVLIGGGVLLVAIVVVLLIAKSAINGWLHGDGFRDWLAARCSAALRSEVSLAEMKWEGSEVYTSSFNALGSEAAAFSKLGLDGVRAKMGGIQNKAFEVPEISVNRLNLEFSSKRKEGKTPEESTFSSGAAEGPALPSWLSRFAPDRVEVDRILVSNADVSVENEVGPVFLLSGTRSTMEPDFRTGSWEISAEGGKIALPGQPEIRLKDLGLRWRGSELFIDQCALGIYKDGHIDGKGEIGFEDHGHFDVDLEISSIQVDELVTGEWRDRLSGVIDGPVRITGAPGALVYEGTMNVTEGVIEAIPVLKRIAQYTRSERFNRLVLNQATVDFKSAEGRVELRNLVLQSDGLVRVEGQIDLVGEQLTGDLRVGVTPGTMRWIPGAERLVFVEDRDGFRWASMKLSGTTVEPKEDLTGRLVAAAGEAIVTELPTGVIEGAQELLNPSAGTPKTDELIEQGKKALDLFTPFLNRQ